MDGVLMTAVEEHGYTKWIVYVTIQGNTVERSFDSQEAAQAYARVAFEGVDNE